MGATDTAGANRSWLERLGISLPAVWPAVRYLSVGLGTAFVSWFALMALFLSTVLGVTLPALPSVVWVIRKLTGFERRRVAKVLGIPPIPEAYRPLDEGLALRIQTALTDRGTRRDLGALALQSTLGLLVGMLGFGMPLAVLQNVPLPLYWWALTGYPTSFGFEANTFELALATSAIGVGCAIFTLWAVPRLARWYARIAAARLAPGAGTLVERVAELTATRAAALEAHGAELRRIERDLHDGTQNRLVAVVMHLGIVERTLRRDPEQALPLVLSAQNAATDALAELRDVVRSIYPPILTDRGLDGAVSALVARCSIPCTLDVDQLRRVPAAVEAAAYFVVAEALTNVAKHSGAENAKVTLATEGELLVIEVADDGHGGADETGGTGLAGIRRRVAAFDGNTALSSPLGGPTIVRVELPCGS